MATTTTMDRAKEDNEKTYMLIEMLHSYPSIWDVKCKEYKDRDLKKKAFEEVSQAMDWTVAQVLEKYKNLRTYYTRERRKTDSSMKSGSGTTDTYKFKWEFFDALDVFLLDTVRVTTPSSNLTSEAKDIDEDNEDATAEEKLDSSTQQQQGSFKPKRKRPRKEDEFIMQAMDVLKTPAPSSSQPTPPESQDAIFATLIKSQLEDIPDGKNKEYLKLKIQQLIVETKFDDSDYHPHSQPQFQSQSVGSYQYGYAPFRPVPTVYNQSDEG